MTPKEKAVELRDKYYDELCVIQFDTKYRFDLAKECATIAVEEILKLSTLSRGWQEGIDLPTNDRQRPYWEEVLTELEKL